MEAQTGDSSRSIMTICSKTTIRAHSEAEICGGVGSDLIFFVWLKKGAPRDPSNRFCMVLYSNGVVNNHHLRDLFEQLSTLCFFCHPGHPRHPGHPGHPQYSAAEHLSIPPSAFRKSSCSLRYCFRVWMPNHICRQAENEEDR